MYCRKCGKKIDSDKTICEYCENSLEKNELPTLKNESIQNIDNSNINENNGPNVEDSKLDNNSNKKNIINYSLKDNGLPLILIFLIILGVGFAIDKVILSDTKINRIFYSAYDSYENKVSHKDNSTNTGFLNELVTNACYGDYETIYKSINDNSMGIFMCSDSKEVYSFKEDRKESYYIYGKAEYYGTIYDELVEKYFSDGYYLYRKLYNADYHDELILLLEADSESELIDKNIDKIYDYIKELNKDYETDIDITIFYTEKLDTINKPLDYILLALYTRTVYWLPHGNMFGNYVFKVDDNYECLAEIASDRTLYSSQTRDALKFKRHIYIQIEDGRNITKETLRTRLNNSFVEGNN